MEVADFSKNKLWLPPQAGCPPSRRTVSVLRRLPYMSVRAGNLLICDRVKPVKEGNTPEEAEWKGSVDLTCAPVPLLWHYLGKRNDFPNNNTLKQHQENDRHMHFTSLFISMLLRVLDEGRRQKVCRTGSGGWPSGSPFSCPAPSVGDLSTMQDHRLTTLAVSPGLLLVD